MARQHLRYKNAESAPAAASLAAVGAPHALTALQPSVAFRIVGVVPVKLAVAV